MDNVIEQLFSFANIIFCLIVWVLVWIQRKVIHTVWKKAEQSMLYREFFLPIGPLFTGGILAALVANYPYPEQFHSFGARVFFGIVCGLLSAHVYKIVKGLINKKREQADNGQGPDLLK